MDQQIQNILEDLYRIDPGFKKHERQLAQIVAQILEAKPDTKFDEAFARDLRRKLSARADMLMEGQRAGIVTNKYNLMKKFTYAFGSVALVALVVLGAVVSRQPGGKVATVSNSNKLLSSKLEVTKLGSNAFGAFTAEELTVANGRGGGGTTAMYSPSPEVMSNSGTNATEPATPPTTDSKMVAEPGIGIMPPYYQYRYVYKGSPFTVEEDTMDIYRRVKGLPSGVDAQSLLGELGVGLINMNSFSNTTLDSLQISENKDFGYTFYINLPEGTVSIYENWSKWPNPTINCMDEACYRASQLKQSDMPEDSQVISIANQFLADHGVSLENYGQPQVQNYWRAELARYSDPSQFYFPDVMSVVYPLKLNGGEVYDESGNPTGLMVNVNVRHMKASGVSELSAQRYEASSYDTEKDTTRLLKLAQQGGFRYGPYPPVAAGENVRTADIELGDPTVSYVKIWQYKSGVSSELLVPALMFPVTKQPSEGYFYQKSVVIPLIKQILDESANNGSPIPLIMDAPVSSVAPETKSAR